MITNESYEFVDKIGKICTSFLKEHYNLLHATIIDAIKYIVLNHCPLTISNYPKNKAVCKNYVKSYEPISYMCLSCNKLNECDFHEMGNNERNEYTKIFDEFYNGITFLIFRCLLSEIVLNHLNNPEVPK